MAFVFSRNSDSYIWHRPDIASASDLSFSVSCKTQHSASILRIHGQICRGWNPSLPWIRGLQSVPFSENVSQKSKLTSHFLRPVAESIVVWHEGKERKKEEGRRNGLRHACSKPTSQTASLIRPLPFHASFSSFLPRRGLLHKGTKIAVCTVKSVIK